MKVLFLFALSFLASLRILAQTELTPTDQQALVKFTIVDPKGIPEEGAIIKVSAVDKKFAKEGVADIDGKFSMLVPEGAPFTLVVHKFNVDFDFGVQNIPMNPGPQTSNMKLSIELVTTYKRVYTLKSVYFESGQYLTSTLKPLSIQALNDLADTLKVNPKMKIEVAGHTDNVGDAVANQHLSQKRADAIREYLIKKSISADRVLSKGYGQSAPIASNDTPEGKSFNRRTEVRIIEE